jgi:hypothetical protein
MRSETVFTAGPQLSAETPLTAATNRYFERFDTTRTLRNRMAADCREIRSWRFEKP